MAMARGSELKPGSVLYRSNGKLYAVNNEMIDPKRKWCPKRRLIYRTRGVSEFSALKRNEKPQCVLGGPGHAGASIFRNARNAILTLHVIPATI